MLPVLRWAFETNRQRNPKGSAGAFGAFSGYARDPNGRGHGHTDLESEICDADIVVTGEGRLDSQSCMGKAPVGVARAAKKHGKTVIAFAGAVSPDARLANSHGIDAFFPIVRRPVTLSEAMDKKSAYENLRDTAEQVFRLIAVYDGVNKA